jgi:hypothetical protein
MHIGDHSQFGAADLREPLRTVLGAMDVGNGTPLADALASALQLDLRMSGRKDGPAVIAALTADEMISLAVDLEFALKYKNSSFTLPLGTLVESREIADLRIGGEHWILNAGRPGLHPMESMRRDAHGPNLDLLLSHIERLTRKLACRRIGLPSPAHIVDTDDRQLLHFPPFAPAGGVVLQRWANGTDAPRFCAALPGQILELAKSIVADMRVMWTRRGDIAARAGFVRSLVEPAAAEHGAEVQLIAIDLRMQHNDANLDMYVHYLALDEAMRPGPVLDFIPCRDHITPEFYSAPIGVVYRREDIEVLRNLGADGWIDDMAAAIAAAAPDGAASVFAQLATSYEATVVLPTDAAPLFATLYWRDGLIRAEMSMADGLDFCRGQLDVPGLMLPDHMQGQLVPPRKVDDLAKLPFECPCTVIHAEPRDKGARLELELGKRLIELSSGRIWDDPTPGR